MRSSSRSEFTVVGLYGSPEYAALQMLARFVDLPEPQQIRAELGMRRPQVRLHLDGAPQQRRRFAIAATHDLEVRELLVHRAVARVVVERALDPRRRIAIARAAPAPRASRKLPAAAASACRRDRPRAPAPSARRRPGLPPARAARSADALRPDRRPRAALLRAAARPRLRSARRARAPGRAWRARSFGKIFSASRNSSAASLY